MKLELADIATDEKRKLNGFKVFGIFPFYLKYVKVITHNRLCKIREMINEVSPDEPKFEDFYNSKLQDKVIPLILKYCQVALVNNRKFSWFFNWVLKRKLKECGHYHILNLFLTIKNLDEPAFFLSYWKLIKLQDNTLLKAAGQS